MKKACELKLVILYDPRNDTHTVVEHNLDPKDAVAEAVAMRKKRLPAFTVEQTTRHRASHREQCAACIRDVTKVFAVRAATPKKERR